VLTPPSSSAGSRLGTNEGERTKKPKLQLELDSPELHRNGLIKICRQKKEASTEEKGSAVGGGERERHRGDAMRAQT
jgi:hypothetical protein